MSEPRLKVENIKVKQLIQDFDSCHIATPEFQRGYVWRKSKAPKLIDSLYRRFPIASLLLWESPQATVRSRRKAARPFPYSPVSWLIDGQQRVTTLSRIRNGDEGIEVLFNPETEEFALANAAKRTDHNWVSVSELWDDGQYRQIRKQIDVDGRANQLSAERLEELYERVRSILDFEVPAVRMQGHSFADAVDAFTRINTQGVRLKNEDIESAQVAAKHSGFIKDQVIPYLDRLASKGFTRLNVMHLFRVCAFIATPDRRSRTPLHELDRRSVLAAWRKTVSVTDHTLALVRSELGLINMEILWSGALLVPMIAVQAKTAPLSRNPKAIVGWLALASLHHRYSKASDTALDQDLRACRESDPFSALLANLRQMRPSLLATPDDFAGSLNDRGGMLAAYIACKQRGIKDLFTGGSILLQDTIDKHHILPRGQFPEEERASSDKIANIAFVSGSVNRAIGVTGPEVYLSKVKPGILVSQCIPTDSESWRIDEAFSFLSERRSLLAQAFNDFLKQSLPGRKLG